MTTFRALRALYWLHDHRHQPVAALPADVVPLEDARDVYDELRAQDALADTLTMGGGPDGDFDFYLTPEGRVQARRARDIYRHELALRRVLEEKVAAADGDQGQLQLSRADDFSGPLTAAEIRNATHHLVDLGLCEGRKRADGEFFHVDITPKGRAAARRPYLIEEEASAPSAPATNISANNYGTMTVGSQVIGGQGHTINATVTQGVSLDEALEAIGRLRKDVEAAPGIDDEDRAELLEEIDTMTTKAGKRGLDWLKSTLFALGTQLATTAGQGLADQAVAIGTSII